LERGPDRENRFSSAQGKSLKSASLGDNQLGKSEKTEKENTHKPSSHFPKKGLLEGGKKKVRDCGKKFRKKNSPKPARRGKKKRSSLVLSGKKARSKEASQKRKK